MVGQATFTWRTSGPAPIRSSLLRPKIKLYPTMKVSFFPIKQFCVHPLILTVALSFAVTAYAQQDTQQVEARVNEILSQMTLDEKINYISGAIVNFASLDGVFNIKPLPRLGLPEIFGNDGTIGILGQALSDSINPRNPQSCFRTLVIRKMFWQAYTPLTLLYEPMYAAVFPSFTASSNGGR